MKMTHCLLRFVAAALIVLPLGATAASVTDLVAVLKAGGDRKQSADACRELAQIGSPEAIAPLAALLADENLNHMARYALEPIDSPAVDQAFRDAVPKLTGRPLAGVVTSLGVRRDAKAVKLLTPLLVHSDPNVAQAAARALGDIGNLEAAEALRKTLPAGDTLAIYEGLLRCAEHLHAANQTRQARDLYAMLRDAAAPHQVRAGGLRGLILTSGSEAPRVLQQALQNSDYTQFAAAARTAQETSAPAITETLAAELPKLAPDRQIVLLQTLAFKADPIGLAAVVNASRSQDKAIRIAALRALPQFENATVGGALLEPMFDADKDVARAAQDGMAGLLGRDVDTAVVALLSHADVQRRLIGVDLVSRRRMATALPDVSRLAADADPKVRIAAVQCVGELGGKAQLPFLLDLLQHPKSNQDMEAAENALEVVSVKPGSREPAVAAIQAQLGKSEPAQKSALLRVLTTIGGPEALNSVRNALTDASADVRAGAVRSLAGWSTPDAAPDLLRLSRESGSATEKTLALRGYLAMAARGDVGEPQRIEMCRQAAPLVERAEEKRLLLAALGSINSPDALPVLESYLGDSAVKDEAATAMLSLADKLLKRDNAAQLAARLVGPLEKVVQNTTNEKLTGQAKALLQQAKAKAQ